MSCYIARKANPALFFSLWWKHWLYLNVGCCFFKILQECHIHSFSFVCVCVCRALWGRETVFLGSWVGGGPVMEERGFSFFHPKHIYSKGKLDGASWSSIGKQHTPFSFQIESWLTSTQKACQGRESGHSVKSEIEWKWEEQHRASLSVVFNIIGTNSPHN